MITFVCFAEKDPNVVENWLAIWRHLGLLHLTLLLAAPGARQALQFHSAFLLQVSTGKNLLSSYSSSPMWLSPKGQDISVKEAERPPSQEPSV